MNKIHPLLAKQLSVRTDRPLRVIVKHRGKRNGRHFALIGATAQTLSWNDIKAYAQLSDVEMIYPDRRVHTCLAESVPLIGAPAAWQSGYTGRGLLVAVVDTGVDDTRLRNRVIHKNLSDDYDARDYVGHGTHVASIVGGVAPDVLFLNAKVLGGDGSGSESDVMAGIEWAVFQGARVINLSLGTDEPGDGTDALSLMCDAAVERGVVVCAAAGNAGPGPMTVGSPGCAKLVITVGATTKNDTIASFSSRGPTVDGRVKPDIVFPGVSIVAARATGTAMGTPIDEYYTRASGTSMATPHCAGAAALLLQAHPDWPPSIVKRALMETAKDIGETPNVQGMGRGCVTLDWTPVQPEPLPDGCKPVLLKVFTGTSPTP